MTTASAEFAQRIKPFRRELLAHCYRMLGSVDDAEDAVQETYIRAWRAAGSFEGRSQFRSWVYKIATNVCLSALAHRTRRVLPSSLGPPALDPHAVHINAGSELSWLEPMPDALAGPAGADPAEIAISRENIRLALIASLQYLSPRQRAVLLLRQVLSFSSAEVAAILDVSVAAVKSSLQRARACLNSQAPKGDQIREPSEPERLALLDRYIKAFENSDAKAIELLLCADATLEMTPSRTWFAGNKICLPFIATYALGSPGDWKMIPSSANGQPAAIAYRRDVSGAYQPFGIAILTLHPEGIAGVVVFGNPALVARFTGANKTDDQDITNAMR